MISFRIHYADGSKIDVQAKDAKGAQVEAAKRNPGQIIAKIKVVRS